MNKKILILFVAVLIQTGSLYAADVNPEMDAMLRSAESLFLSMQQKDYPGIWGRLSQKSKQTIVNDTLKAVRSTDGNITKDAIDKDFAAGGGLAQAYWNSFLANFNPILILEQSTWELAKVHGNQAQIKITYRKADNPALLKMYKEDGMWRVGLTESFWVNKSRLK